MNAKHASLTRAGRVITRKAQYPVNTGHPVFAQVDVYDQLATTPQDKAAALGTAKT